VRDSLPGPNVLGPSVSAIAFVFTPPLAHQRIGDQGPTGSDDAGERFARRGATIRRLAAQFARALTRDTITHRRSRAPATPVVMKGPPSAQMLR
jgi:hypothetical protein